MQQEQARTGIEREKAKPMLYQSKKVCTLFFSCRVHFVALLLGFRSVDQAQLCSNCIESALLAASCRSRWRCSSRPPIAIGSSSCTRRSRTGSYATLHVARTRLRHPLRYCAAASYRTLVAKPLVQYCTALVHESYRVSVGLLRRVGGGAPALPAGPRRQLGARPSARKHHAATRTFRSC